MPRNFRPEKSAPKKVYVPAKTRQSTLPKKKYPTFLLGTHGLRAGMSAGLKKLCGSPQHSKKTLLYKGSTCADCICSEKACLLQPLLASGICYYSEAAIYPFPHSTHGPVNWQGPAFWLPVPTMSSQYRKFMFMSQEEPTH